jgi:hypothetical protein
METDASGYRKIRLAHFVQGLSFQLWESTAQLVSSMAPLVSACLCRGCLCVLQKILSITKLPKSATQGNVL